MAVLDSLIEMIDFEPVKVSFLRRHPGWCEEEIDLLIFQYRLFLHVKKKFRGRQVMPSAEIDEFWHEHILHTVKYRNDCAEFLGFFLDHTPIDDLTEAECNAIRDETIEMFMAEFPHLV